MSHLPTIPEKLAARREPAAEPQYGEYYTAREEEQAMMGSLAWVLAFVIGAVLVIIATAPLWWPK